MFIHDFKDYEIDAAVSSLSAEFAATAAEYDRTAAFPHRNIERLRAFGLPALVVPKEFGGAGAGLARAEGVVNAIARGEASTGLVLAQQYLFHGAIRRDESFPATLRERIYRSAVETGAFANSLRVEPDLGTPLRGGLPATVARRTAEGWVLDGHKIYSTGSPVLAWHAIWARTDEETPRVGVFVVPGDNPGLSIVETWRHMGMRASGSHDVVLRNAVIPADHVASLKSPSEASLPDARLSAWIAVLFSTVYDGAARAARDWFIGFLRDRRPANLGASLATLPQMQAALGEIESALYANRVLLADIGRRVDAGDLPSPQESLYVKHNVTTNALAAVSRAMEVSGNPGLAQANALERHYRDVLCARVHSPQNDTIFLNGGRLALAAAGVGPG